MAGNKYARYTFTIQGWDREPTYNETHMNYIIWGRETAPTTGQQHLQGYVRFKNRKYFNFVKRALPDGAHIEPAEYSEKHNRDYCSKEGQFTEHGTYEEEAGQQGKRTDLEKVVQTIKSGATLAQVIDAHPTEWIKFHAGIASLHSALKAPPPTIRETTVTILWGPTGVGKTHRVRTKYPGGCMIKAGRDPWASYTSQEVIVFDEFDYNRWTIQDMNMYCDKWTCELDCRYANKQAYWTKVFILANTNPFEWWPLEHQSLRESFWRRLTHNIFVHSQEEQIEI